jgi:eukaryotic-like serine/threonine-protein kinase
VSTTNRPPSIYVDDVFDEVLALPDERREAAIAARCAGHPSIATEVRALLAAEHENRKDAPTPLRPGEQIGRYHLAQCLGTGASASVWKAFDTHLEAWTALKLIHPEFGRRSNALDTVMNEARAASGIISDHVVRIKSAGQIANGPHYIEMQLCAEHRPRDDGQEELVVGFTLAHEKTKSTREAARLVMEAALGTEAAHRVGVLHRDIKPANILLTPVSRRALVADFGLSAPQLYPAPQLHTSPHETVTLMMENHDGVLVGTPPFMPPEQAFGHPPNRTTDVYALGATLYCLIAGRAPYMPTSNHSEIPALDIVAQVRQQAPPALSTVAPHAPERLVRIVNKAMQRSPKARYPTAADMASDLQLYLNDLPTSQDSGRPVLALGLFMQRNREVVSAAAIIALMLLVFAGLIVQLNVKRNQAQAQMEAAQERRNAAEEQALAAEHVRATAENDRDRAQAAASEAQQMRNAANEARKQAERSEDQAERRAATEIELRRDAELQRDEALNAREEALTELDEETLIRIQREADLAVKTERLGQVTDNVAQLEASLEEMTTTKMTLAVERDDLSMALLNTKGVVRGMSREMDALKQEIEFQKVQLRNALEEVEAARQVPVPSSSPEAPVPFP